MEISKTQIHLLGTSHISAQSVAEIKRVFAEFNPDIVAIELDKNRFEGLMSGEKPSYSPKLIGQIGLFGYLFAVVGGILQKKLGNLVGMSPGSEMKEAALLARQNNRKLALIDQDVRIKLKRLSQEFTFKQKMRLVWDIISSPFSKKMKIDLTKVPEKKIIQTLMRMLKDRYPGLHKALIDERNEYMTNKIISITKVLPGSKILVVVGAGHIDGIQDLLNLKIVEQNKAQQNLN